MPDLFAADPAHAPRPLTGRSEGWVPTEYMDEVCPPCRPTPSDWILAGEIVRLAPLEKGAAPGRVIHEGDTLFFDELAVFPAVRAVWNGPGSYSLLSPAASGATCFCLPGDSDALDLSIESFMANNGENGAFEPGEALEIEAFDWSTKGFTFRGGRFVDPLDFLVESFEAKVAADA